MVKKVIKKTTTVTEEIIDDVPDGELTVALLLDESGSMGSILTDTIGAVNRYFGKLKEDEKTRNLRVMLKTFSSFHGGRIIVEKKLVSDLPIAVLTTENYTPNGGTPLYDAMGDMMNDLEQWVPGKVLFTTVSDGQENSSRRWDRAGIAERIKRLGEVKGWEFNFLGTNFDAYAASAGLGIARANTMNFAQANMGATMDSFAGATTRYTHSGGLVGSSAYTAAEKTASGDTVIDPNVVKPSTTDDVKTNRKTK